MGLRLYPSEGSTSVSPAASAQEEVQHMHATPRNTQRRRQQQQEVRLGTFAAECWGRDSHLVPRPYEAVGSSSELGDQHASGGFGFNGAGIGSHLVSSQLSLHGSQNTSTVYPAEILEDDASLISQSRFSNEANSPYTPAGRQRQLDSSSAWWNRQPQQ